MRNYLDDFLTAGEQKILIFFCLFLFIGLTFGSVTAKHSKKQQSVSDSLQQIIQTPVVLKVDIRTAGKEELMSLPGIGAKRADDILSYRSEHGFQSCIELTEVKGIGSKTLEKLKPNLIWFGADSDTVHMTQVDKKPVFTGRVNINAATLDELMQLPGIGPVKAQAIIDKRIELGSFTSTEQIMEVKGIGPKTYEKLKDMITVGDSS